MSYDLSQRAADYARMEAALAWLARRWRDAPSLDEAAAAAGLSPHHFQRVFTRWAGVSPKTFVAALAHAEAGARLAEGDTVLDAALEAGLSGPSRLHDLFVAHEGVTPGEARRRGEGLTLTWGFAPTPFGLGVFVCALRGLAGLGFVDADGEAAGLEDMRRRWPAAQWVRDDAGAQAMTQRVFGAGARPRPWPWSGRHSTCRSGRPCCASLPGAPPAMARSPPWPAVLAPTARRARPSAPTRSPT